jgi:carotenoid cleavage dioxygenase-like enzyme
MDDFPPSYLHRWTFDLDTGRVTETPLDDTPHAFPRVDDRVVGLRHRYGWAAAPRAGVRERIGDPGVLVKYDLETGARARYDFGPTAHPGEFVFVRDGDAGGEDDGWAMGLVYDDATERSELVIVDASDAAAGPVARVQLPRRVPYGFHGSWISDAELP